MRFENRTAIVTGAGRGIGLAIATRLASEGARVAVVSRSSGNAQAAAAAIETAHPGQATPFAVDVADRAAVDSALPRMVEALGGRVDILVNNAGITRDGLLMRMTQEDWDATIATNLTGVFHMTAPLLRTFLKQRSGRIVNISSIAGVSGNAGQCNYAASKAGLIGFTKSLAREAAGRGVTANVVAPGFIKTDMTDVLSEDIKASVLQKIPLGVFGEPEDIAAATAFLASDEAKFITGQVLIVDGGMVM